MISAAAILMLSSMLYSLRLSSGSFPKPLSAKEEQEYLEKEARRLAYERRSARRVAIGTRLLGEKGYAKLKALLKGR